jgi:hypothetical protein
VSGPRVSSTLGKCFKPHVITVADDGGVLLRPFTFYIDVNSRYSLRFVISKIMRISICEGSWMSDTF